MLHLPLLNTAIDAPSERSLRCGPLTVPVPASPDPGTIIGYLLRAQPAATTSRWRAWRLCVPSG